MACVKTRLNSKYRLNRISLVDCEAEGRGYFRQTKFRLEIFVMTLHLGFLHIHIKKYKLFSLTTYKLCVKQMGKRFVYL